jgi:gluconolactonase
MTSALFEHGFFFGSAPLRLGRGRVVGATLLLVLGLWGVANARAQQRPVPNDATVELVDRGFEFTEGPLWYDGTLLFSDIPANTVYRWTPDGGTRVFVRPSGHANGLAVDTAGHLLLAQHDGRIVRRADDGSMTPLVQSYGGKRLNSPNDLTVASDGTIYFTDPPYGVDKSARELSFSGVYRLSPNGDLRLLTKALPRPNGICLSPDDSTLYVNDSRNSVVRAYDVTAQGTIENGRRFAAPSDPDVPGATDGMKVDAEGNLYTTGPGGVWVYAPDGTQQVRIAVPKPPTNLAFGGPERKTLFITARPHVYRVSVNVPGSSRAGRPEADSR